jgi:hypothetical protein
MELTQGQPRKFERMFSTHPSPFPSNSSNLDRSSSTLLSSPFSEVPCVWPWSSWNALQSRRNWSRSFTRVIESSGSFEPRIRARYDATIVASAPERVEQSARWNTHYYTSHSPSIAVMTEACNSSSVEDITSYSSYSPVFQLRQQTNQ